MAEDNPQMTTKTLAEIATDIRYIRTVMQAFAAYLKVPIPPAPRDDGK